MLNNGRQISFHSGLEMKDCIACALSVVSLLAISACDDAATGTASSTPPAAGKSAIYISTKAPDAVRREMGKLNPQSMPAYLAKLEKADRKFLDRSPDTITVAYILFDRIEPGDVVSTEWSVSRTSMASPYSEKYDYAVGQNDPLQPFVVLNSLYNENPGTFVFTAKVNGRPIQKATKIYQ